MKKVYDSRGIEISICSDFEPYKNKLNTYFKDGYFDNMIDLYQTEDNCYIYIREQLTYYIFQFNDVVVRFITNKLDDNKFNYTPAVNYKHILTKNSIRNITFNRTLKNNDVVAEINDEIYYCSEGDYYMVIDENITQINTTRENIVKLCPQLVHDI